jgi:putative transposase
MQKPRQSYILEFKLKAVELSNGYYNTIRATQELDTSAENIRKWKNQLDDGMLGYRIKLTKESKLQRLKKLRRELTEVKMERDIAMLNTKI